MLRYGDSDAFCSIIIFRYTLKGPNHGFYTVLLLAEAGESCLSPRPRVQSAPEDSSNINAMK